MKQAAKAACSVPKAKERNAAGHAPLKRKRPRSVRGVRAGGKDDVILRLRADLSTHSFA